jgi:hypothetical protein
MGLLMMGGLVCGADPMAHEGAPLEDIQQQLVELYQTTKATADGSDIVAAGSVLVLQKDHLLMDPIEQAIPMPNVYKNGAITGLSGAAGLIKAMTNLKKFNPFGHDQIVDSVTEGANATREFVAQEKFWVTKIETKPDGVTFSLLSDPIKDKRYHATLQFPFAKGAAPTVDDAAGLVAEVLKIDAGDNAQGQKSAANPTPQRAAPAAPAPKTVTLGQSRDQVIAALGVPAKVMQVGAKEIDVYSDVKVTFLQNQVVDVN